MVEKISLNILVPAVGQNHDFIVPCKMPIGEVIHLVLKLLQEEYKGIKADFNEIMLVSLEDYKVLKNDAYICDLIPYNGYKLMMI